VDRKTHRLSQFLKKIFGHSLLPPAEVGECFASDFISHLPNDSEWHSVATTFQDIISMRTPLFLRLFGLNVLHNHVGPQTHASHSMPMSMHYFAARILMFSFLYLHCTHTERDLHENEKRHCTKTQKISNRKERGLLHIFKNWTV
jgi:hypothetical protein